ncbi:ABC transporter permease [uncultured Sphaerochaeta sp.]|uniref:ABC transporter permease n=1 Tax=uncultured Sphaerochaeta sp. TaxID=886478 RepID=UPI002A0A2969|nr:ABC transporter permease [uncultured Sphaerochaeta sp.]
MLKTIKKAETMRQVAILQYILSIVTALSVTALVMAVWGYNPISVYKEIVFGSLGSVYRIRETVNTMIPLLVMALGVAVCFKANFINIGAEGQFFAGAVAATWVVRIVGESATRAILPAMMIAAFVAGGLWCMIAAVLKVRLDVNETVVTLLLNYVAVKGVSYLQYVHWKDSKAYGFPRIANYPKVALLPKVFGVHCGWIIAVVLVVLVWLLFARSKKGYEISIVGDNPRTARYAGISSGKVFAFAAMVGGGLCGLAGMIQASGIERTMNDQMSGGMGFTAIVVAYMAKLDPRFIVVASAFFAIMVQGGSYIQSSLQVPSETADILQGIILLFLLGSEFFTKYRIEGKLRHRGVAR